MFPLEDVYLASRNNVPAYKPVHMFAYRRHLDEFRAGRLMSRGPGQIKTIELNINNTND